MTEEKYHLDESAIKWTKAEEMIMFNKSNVESIEEAIKRLEQECEKLKEYIKDLQTRKDRYYLQVLEYERQVSDWISFYIKVRDIVAGNYEMLESQGLQDLRRIINEVEK